MDAPPKTTTTRPAKAAALPPGTPGHADPTPIWQLRSAPPRRSRARLEAAVAAIAPPCSSG